MQKSPSVKRNSVNTYIAIRNYSRLLSRLLVYFGSLFYKQFETIWVVTCDFHQCGILTSLVEAQISLCILLLSLETPNDVA